MDITLTIVAIAASVLGSAMALPQALRLFRTGRTDGVSPMWIGVSIAINGWWIAYGAGSGRWAIVPVAVASLLVYASIGVVYLRASATAGVRPLLAGLLVLGMVPLPALLVGGWKVAGVAVGLSYGMQLAPAVIASYRTRDLLGVSVGTWTISFAEALLWLGYGFGVGDSALLLSGVIGALMAGAILGRLVVTGHAPALSGSVRRVALT